MKIYNIYTHINIYYFFFNTIKYNTFMMLQNSVRIKKFASRTMNFTGKKDLRRKTYSILS